ncbi:MAG TPA: hypothetical protein VLT45_10755, partial [Kofleriaceae bacterium]|nr:hypothetical protein [Kofleriaceae bacterium]
MLEIEWTDSGGTTTVIDWDVATSEHFEGTAEVTDHAVEDGASVSDHVIPANATVTVECVASNHPIVTRTFGMNGATMSTQPASVSIGGNRTASVSVFQGSQQFDRVRAIDEQMETLRLAGQRLTIRTSLREVTPVVLTSFDVTREDSEGNILNATCTFRKVRVARTQRVPVTRPQHRRGQQTQNRGNQPATTPPAPPDSVSWTF